MMIFSTMAKSGASRTWHFTIDGRNYDFDGPANATQDQLGDVARSIISSSSHQEYLVGRQRVQSAIQGFANSLGLPTDTDSTTGKTTYPNQNLGTTGAINALDAGDYDSSSGTPDYLGQGSTVPTNDPAKINQSTLDYAVPGYDEALQNQQGFMGGVRRFVGNFIQPENLATLAAAGPVGEAAGIPGLLSKLFIGAGAYNTGKAIADTDTLHSDPGMYAANILTNAGLTALGVHGEAQRLAQNAVPDLDYGDGSTGAVLPPGALENSPEYQLAQRTSAVKARAAATNSLPGSSIVPPDMYNADGGAATTQVGNPDYGIEPVSPLPRIINTNQSEGSTVPTDTSNDLTPEDLQALKDSGRPVPTELLRQAADKVRNFWYEGLSGMTRQAPDSSAAAVEYASSPDIARLNMYQAAPEVSKEFATPEEEQQFQTYAVANRMAQLHRDMIREGATPAERADIAYQPNGGGRLLDPVSNTPITSDMLEQYFNRPSV